MTRRPATSRRKAPARPRRRNPDGLRIVRKVQPAPRGQAAVFLDGFDGRRRVAEMAVEELDRRGSMWTDFLRGDCGAGYRAACDVAGVDLRVFVVTFSSVSADAQNRGFGVDLYADAVAWAASHGGCLAPTRCVYGAGTSEAAERVWRSRRFASRVRLHGGVAVERR